MLRQTCRVRVRGRRQRYRRALQVIQDEEYLDALGKSFQQKLIITAVFASESF